MLPGGVAAIALNGCGILNHGPADSTQLAASPLVVTPQPRPGGALRIGLAGDIVPAAVPHMVHASNFQLNPLVYDTLVRYDQRMNPQPALSTSWTWSSDFRRLTLSLRAGVRFHSGRLLTSQDVRSNLERLRDPPFPPNGAITRS